MKPATIVAALDRERRQLQGSDPALRPPLQRHDIPPRQLQLHHLVQVRGGLLGREAQIRRADLDELATPAPATERQRRVGAGGDHQVHLWRQVLNEECHPVLDVVRIDDVVVVEHQHDVARQPAEVVEQRGKDRCDRRGCGDSQQGDRGRAYVGHHRLQRSDHVGPEGSRPDCR